MLQTYGHRVRESHDRQIRPDIDTEDRHDPILNQRTKNRRSSRCRSLVSRLQSQSLEHESVSFHFQHRLAGDDLVATGHTSLLNDVGFPTYLTATGPVQFHSCDVKSQRSSGQVMRHIAPSSCRTRATWGGQRMRMVILGQFFFPSIGGINVVHGFAPGIPTADVYG